MMDWKAVFTRLFGFPPDAEVCAFMEPLLQTCASGNDPMVLLMLQALYISQVNTDEMTEVVRRADEEVKKLAAQSKEQKLEVAKLGEILRRLIAALMPRSVEVATTLSDITDTSIKTAERAERSNERFRQYVGEVNNLDWKNRHLFKLCLILIFGLMALAIAIQSSTIWRVTTEPKLGLTSAQALQVMVLDREGKLDPLLTCKIAGYFEDRGRCIPRKYSDRANTTGWPVNADLK